MIIGYGEGVVISGNYVRLRELLGKDYGRIKGGLGKDYGRIKGGLREV